jgi:glycosyltransferase involved in cell wall biosynthesis
MLLGKKIVVVMPAYNAANTLRQTYSELPHDHVDDVILVDDASVDETARLMQAVDLEESHRSRRRNFGWNWHALLPRMAVTAAVVLFAGLTVRHYEIAARRTTLARNVAMVAGAQPLPSVDALNDFDVIQRMSQPHADDEVLALLQ